MISCEQSRQFLPLLHDDELDGPLRREVRDHVVSCTTCTRIMSMLDRSCELLQQTIQDEVDNFDFSEFWQGVEKKLLTPQPDWRDQLQVRWASWRSLWSWRAPAWAAVAAMILIGTGILLTRQQPLLTPAPDPPFQTALADSDQAQIESLSASDTISVWNEPTSNATVIWVSDEGEGGMQ